MPSEEEQFQRNTESEAEIQDDGWSPTSEAQNQELTRWQLNADDILEFIEHELRGQDFDYTQRTWLASGEAVLNERGIRTIIGVVRHHVNKVMFLSNLEDQQIYDMMYNLSNNLAQLLFNNGDEFGLDWARGHQSSLIDNVCDLVFAGLRKAYGEGERKFLGSHTRILHRIDESPQQTKQKRFGLF